MRDWNNKLLVGAMPGPAVVMGLHPATSNTRAEYGAVVAHCACVRVFVCNETLTWSRPNFSFHAFPSLHRHSREGWLFLYSDTAGIPRVTEPITHYLHMQQKHWKNITCQWYDKWKLRKRALWRPRRRWGENIDMQTMKCCWTADIYGSSRLKFSSKMRCVASCNSRPGYSCGKRACTHWIGSYVDSRVGRRSGEISWTRRPAPSTLVSLPSTLGNVNICTVW